MKLQNEPIWGNLVGALATGARDASKPALDKATMELTATSAQPDALRSQLDAAKKEEVSLSAQIADLNTPGPSAGDGLSAKNRPSGAASVRKMNG